jgi:hypothetical protein
MDTTIVEHLKHVLMDSNPEFRELVNEEQWEEITLKKKKLALKDEIYELLAKHQGAAVSH